MRGHLILLGQKRQSEATKVSLIEPHHWRMRPVPHLDRSSD
jgi:hypothetical protein